MRIYFLFFHFFIIFIINLDFRDFGKDRAFSGIGWKFSYFVLKMPLLLPIKGA